MSLWSCQKDLDLYSGRDFIYFNPSAGLDSTYFSFAYVDVNKEVDSLYIMVRTGGEVKDYDRQVKVKVAETNATVDVDYKALADSYTIPAGEHVRCDSCGTVATGNFEKRGTLHYFGIGRE